MHGTKVVEAFHEPQFPNPNDESRNPKEYRNPNDKTADCTPERRSTFELRISFVICNLSFVIRQLMRNRFMVPMHGRKAEKPFMGHLKPVLLRTLAVFGTAAVLLMPSGCRSPVPVGSQEQVGPTGVRRVITPVNQVLTPAGIQVELPGMRPQAIALSPDGNLLLTSGKTHELIVVHPATGMIVQRVPFPSDKTTEPNPDTVSSHLLEPDKEGQLSYTGLIFSPDGRRIFLSNVKGNIKVFGVDQSATVRPLFSIPLPSADAPERKEEIPSGLAISRDGTRLYVALNLSNRLGCALRRCPLGDQGLREQLGRAQAGVPKCHRSGRTRHASAR